MKKILPLLLTSVLLLTTLQASKPVMPDILKTERVKHKKHAKHRTYHRKGPTIQIGLLIDTSNSMDGLINQAKEQLWKIVNEVAKANKRKRGVTIEVGLFEYGKSSIPYYEGYLQMLVPFTRDLDTVSDELFRLRTNGGEEYAGRVILSAVNQFRWSNHKNDLKLLIIAGNEAFTQGDVPYRRAIEKANDYGIVVNTIFCGNINEGRRTGWSHAARIGGGKYFNINHNDRRVYVPSPYDDDIIALGNSLNETYVNYGARSYRKAKKENIYKQDKNSRSMSKASYVERNLVKSKKQYSQASSDMVSAYMEKKSSLSSIKKSELPDELKGKSKKEIRKIIEKKKIKRLKLQKKIKNLERKRDKYLAKKSTTKGKDLGSAIIKSVRKQAKEKGFNFSK